MIGILVTGGAGFVLSNVVRSLLRAWDDAEVALLDLAAKDTLALEFFGPFEKRIRLFKGDVRDLDLLRWIGKELPIAYVVHGATVTHDDKSERANPTQFVDINVGGTVAVLEWARSLSSLRRFVHISTGAVYGRPQPGTPTDIQPESGPFDPPELYAVTKYAAELLVRRYANLFRLPACRVRLSDVFGPMERPMGSRRNMSLPYSMMRAVVEKRPLRITSRTLKAGGDYVSAEDVARAIVAILERTNLAHDVFNIAAGIWRTLPEMFDAFASVASQFQYEVVEPEKAEVDLDPANRLARYNAYSIDRVGELGWSPRRLEDQYRSYLEWVMQAPRAHCPSTAC